MVKFNCLSALGCKKKKDAKEKKESLNTVNEKKELKTLQVRIERLAKTDESDEKKSGSFSILVPTAFGKSSSHKGKVMSHDSPIGGEIEEVAYEGEDELDENVSMKRDFSDCDLQAHVVNTSEETDQPIKKWINNYNSFDTKSGYQSDNRTEKDVEDLVDMVQNGNLSDPGTRKAEFWASPKLKRSCSNLETREVLKKIDEKFPLSKSRSFEEMQRLAEIMSKEVLPGNLGSPDSTITHRSADKVMLKKHSSSQILPSRSRRLWWKLFLWSHRNLHESWTAKQLPVRAPLNQQGGYSSDTLEPNRGMRFGSPSSFTLNKGSKHDDNQSWDGFQGVSGLWPQNQWVAFPTESNSLTRVDEWVKELSSEPPFLDNDDLVEDGIIFSPSPDTGKSPARSTYEFTPHQDMNLPDYILHASSVIQSLNSSSTVAHISGIGLKVIPAIWRFSSLRSVNLSANYIVHITPGSLPKGLHSLNLSRNKISTIEGLRELTRLRVLDLSYNRISRIGQGLSNCTLIKELYLAGNKISDIEGLHRLLKLTILDVSFNKITTTKALGQLVANYSSLQALNLLGNPIQNNINDDQLRKAVCSLLPKLAYLNKQPINPQKARELAAESVARAALGSSDRSARRKAVKRVCQGGSSAFSGQRSSASMSQKGRHRLKTRTYQQSPLKTK